MTRHLFPSQEAVPLKGDLRQGESGGNLAGMDTQGRQLTAGMLPTSPLSSPLPQPFWVGRGGQTRVPQGRNASPRGGCGPASHFGWKSGLKTDTGSWDRHPQEAPQRAGSHGAPALLEREAVSSDVTCPVGHQLKHLFPNACTCPPPSYFLPHDGGGGAVLCRGSGAPYQPRLVPVTQGTVVVTGVGGSSHFWLDQGLQALPGSS